MITVTRNCFNLSIFFLFTLLVGCSSLTFSEQSHHDLMDYDENKNANYYLNQVNKSSEPDKTTLKLLAMRALINDKQYSKANNLAAQLPLTLKNDQKRELELLNAEIGVNYGNAMDLNSLHVNGFNSSQLFRYYQLKLNIDNQHNDINGQAHDFVELTKFALTKRYNEIINQSWSFFHQLTQPEINQIFISANDYILQGWVELAYIYLNTDSTTNYPTNPSEAISADKIMSKDEINVTDNKANNNIHDEAEQIAEAQQEQKIKDLKQALNAWSIQFTNHPAQLIVANLTNTSQTKGKKVALFLPLNGPSGIFGQTIRQGYFDAVKFFQDEPEQTILTYDTTKASINDMIQQARNSQVELIVGPLIKEDVVTIKRLAPNIPVLALNKTENNDDVAKANICFFALSPEDEAMDAAKHIYDENKQHPLLFLPQNDLGHRVAESFAKQWRLLAGETQTVYVNYLDESNKLKEKMKNNNGIALSGQPLLYQNHSSVYDNDFESQELEGPQNQPQFDAVYIYSSYEELSFIKPMIDMELSNNVNADFIMPTIYSSSKSHVGNTTKDFMYDMDKTEFAEIPLIVNQEQFLEQIPENILNNYTLFRLYAMGIDAWQLANHFESLSSNKMDAFEGMTGKLLSNQKCELTRALNWQRYNRGKVIPVD